MKTTKKIVALALAVIMAISLIACGGNTDNSPDPTPDPSIIQMPEGSTFSVKFMDVDNGDAALVECDGKYVLINGGNKKASQKMYAVLKENEISHLEYVIALNTLEKDIGGLAGALNYATAGMTFAAVDNLDEDAFNDFKKYADKTAAVSQCQKLVTDTSWGLLKLNLLL